MKPYFFAEVAPLLKQNGVIDLGIGSPDLPPPPPVIETLQQVSRQNDVHGYGPHAGLPQLRSAFADWAKARFNIILDPQTEVLPLLGSKESIVHLSLALLSANSAVLVPNPGYVPFSFGAKLAGARAIDFDLTEKNNFIPDMEQIESLVTAHKPKILWLNYPNNPTGATINKEALSQLVNLAHQHNFMIGYDNPYSELGYDGYVAPSILEISGAKDVAIEFHSFSKTYHMAGWRVGMAVGNRELIKKLLTMKSNIDSGIFIPIQHAAVTALKTPEQWLVSRNQLLAQRRDITVATCKQAGLTPLKPKAGLYVWAKLPTDMKNDKQFCLDLLKKTGVFITPGSIFGSNGQGWARFTLCQPQDKIIKAGKKLKTFYANNR